MMEENLTPQLEIMVIEDANTLKIIADPFRQEMLRYLEQPRTVKQLAKELNTPPAKLYYHVNMLEESGLIRVTSTRVVSGIIEKHYQVAAKGFHISRALFSITATDKSDENLDFYLSSIFDNTKTEIKRSVKAGLIELDAPESDTHRLYTMAGTMRLTHEQAVNLYARIRELMAEIEKVAGPPGLDTESYGFTMAFYPTLPPTKPSDPDNTEDTDHDHQHDFGRRA